MHQQHRDSKQEGVLDDKMALGRPVQWETMFRHAAPRRSAGVAALRVSTSAVLPLTPGVRAQVHGRQSDGHNTGGGVQVVTGRFIGPSVALSVAVGSLVHGVVCGIRAGDDDHGAMMATTLKPSYYRPPFDEREHSDTSSPLAYICGPPGERARLLPRLPHMSDRDPLSLSSRNARLVCSVRKLNRLPVVRAQAGRCMLLDVRSPDDGASDIEWMNNGFFIAGSMRYGVLPKAINIPLYSLIGGVSLYKQIRRVGFSYVFGVLNGQVRVCGVCVCGRGLAKRLARGALASPGLFSGAFVTR